MAVPICSFEHHGKYDYTAKLKPNDIYNKTTLKPGEGILYTRITEHIDVTFTYTFECSRPASGTTREFTTTHHIDPPTTYEELIRTIDKETGITTSEYSLTINHEIRTVASTDVGTNHKNFTPKTHHKIPIPNPQKETISPWRA